MSIQNRSILPCTASIVLVLASCAPRSSPPADVATDGETDGPVPCVPAEDVDDDTISNTDEAAYLPDFDGDGTPNYEDVDSDADTILDRDEAGDEDCRTPPVDSDGDDLPDFLDTDSDGNGIHDRDEHEGDTDGDGDPDYRDDDDDDDGIADEVEYGDGDDPVDTDGDTVPDMRDTDSDGDTIEDFAEREYDPDDDGIPAYLDDDSDGDGLLDSEEAGDADPETPPRNTDSDGFADFLDIDSDGDGLADGQEVEAGTDPLIGDTDDDGFDDLAEWAHPTADPTDPGSGIPVDDFYLVLPAQDPAVEEFLDFGTDIQVADIFFLVDTTGSMYAEIDQIVSRLNDYIIPEIRDRISDAAFGVGQFADFGQDPYGSATDEPYVLRQAMTTDETLAQAAVEALTESDGGDIPESHVEALYQTVTGDGLGDWIDMGGCPDGVGGACFRPGALPIILLVTDAPMHNGPPASAGDDYATISPAPHTWEEMIDALNFLHAKVIGLDSEPEGLTYARFDMQRAAFLTGTVDDAGEPLVFDIGTEGEALGEGVVDAVEVIATRVAFDVDTWVQDHPDGYDDIEEVDASCFVKSRVPQPDWVPPAGFTAEEAVSHINATTFFDVMPGTLIKFLVRFRNRVSADEACYEGDRMARVFRATIVVRGDGVTDLDEREVIIIVPALPPELG